MIARWDRDKVLFYVAAGIVAVVLIVGAMALVRFLPSAPKLGEIAQWVSELRAEQAPEPGRQVRNTVDPEAAYYAGIMSLCLWSLSDYPKDVAYAECTQFGIRAQASGWYEKWREAVNAEERKANSEGRDKP